MASLIFLRGPRPYTFGAFSFPLYSLELCPFPITQLAGRILEIFACPLHRPKVNGSGGLKVPDRVGHIGDTQPIGSQPLGRVLELNLEPAPIVLPIRIDRNVRSVAWHILLVERIEQFAQSGCPAFL